MNHVKYMKRLRRDLEGLRTLAELARTRELQKRQQAEVIHSILNNFLLPHEMPLRTAFDKITR